MGFDALAFVAVLRTLPMVIRLLARVPPLFRAAIAYFLFLRVVVRFLGAVPSRCRVMACFT